LWGGGGAQKFQRLAKERAGKRRDAFVLNSASQERKTTTEEGKEKEAEQKRRAMLADRVNAALSQKERHHKQNLETKTPNANRQGGKVGSHDKKKKRTREHK